MKDTFRELLLSDESHPVDFDRAWRWLKYASEDSAKARLAETSIARETKTIEGRHSLTIDGFRLLCFGGADDPAHARAVGLQLQEVADELQNERLTAHTTRKVEEAIPAQVSEAGEQGDWTWLMLEQCKQRRNAARTYIIMYIYIHVNSLKYNRHPSSHIIIPYRLVDTDTPKHPTMEATFKEILLSGDSHPVDLEAVWQWLGSTKANVKRRIQKLGIATLVTKAPTSSGGKHREKITLTINDFKRLCIGACTANAKQAAKCFLDIENGLKDQPVAIPVDHLEPDFMGILHSGKSHPVDFDRAWQWLGYSKKANAKRLLSAPELASEVHAKHVPTSAGGNPREVITMTVDGFKRLGMMTMTARGREVREYFLQIEKGVHKLKRAIDAEEVALVPGAAAKRARMDADEERDEQLAILEHNEKVDAIRQRMAASKAEHLRKMAHHRKEMLEMYCETLTPFADDRDKIRMADMARRLIDPTTIIAGAGGAEGTALAIEGGTATHLEISIPIVAQEMQISVGTNSGKIGKVMAAKYRARYGKEPPKRRVIFQGRPINENAYFEPDVDLLREAIREVCV